jgi:hypothetical protein
MNGSYRLSPPEKPAARVYLGKDIAQRASRGSATERAMLAYEVTGGIVDRVTKQQAVNLVGAGRRYVGLLRGMTPLEVAAVHAGRVKLSELVNPRRKPTSDTELDHLIKDIGPGRVVVALIRSGAAVMAAAE